ncbi:MAG: hypothetical protein ACETWM_00135 [Candidatus Lokiarchaeia archaeon]
MTEKFRLVTVTTDVAEQATGWQPAAIRALAEGKIPDTVYLFHIDKPALALARYADALRDINWEACLENNVKVTRSMFASGGYSYAEPGTPILTLGWNTDNHPQLPKRPDDVLMKLLGATADIASEKYKIPIRYRPLNDLELWDPESKVWRKILGCGCSGVFNLIGVGWWVQTTKPSDLLAKVVLSPVEKFADKILKEATERGWSLEEAGAYPLGIKEIDRIREDWREISLNALKKAFNIEVEEGEITDIERQYVEEFMKQFHSEEWILARSAEKRYEEIPPGTNLGKAFLKVPGGPLIRSYVLREGNKIREIMFTGHIHMRPGDALEKLEQELSGLEINEAVIRAKVEEWFNTGIDIAMLEQSQIVNIILEACKKSYEE